MSQEEDLLDLCDDFDSAKPSGWSALQELERATKNCKQVLKQSQKNYDELLAKYNALRGQHNSGQVLHEAVADEEVTDAYVVFKEKLMQGAESGGSRAAKLLKEAVTSFVADIHPHQHSCRIEARVYANLKGLSHELFEEYGDRYPKFSKPHFPRALGAFAAGFSREEVFFDFTDVVDEQAVENKIVQLFQLHVKDPRCKHILFGASGSESYLHVLQAHLMVSGKFTLIQRGIADTSLLRLGLKGWVSSQVFDSLGEGDSIAYMSTEIASGEVNDGHHEIDIKAKRTRAYAMKAASSAPASALPTSVIPGRIPINAVGHRLDTHNIPPTGAQWTLYKARNSKKRLCTAFHLARACPMLGACHYDHTPISSDVYHCLQYTLKEYPCRRKGGCRQLDCFAGHICQRRACAQGRSAVCKFKDEVHCLDMKLVNWVEPETNTPRAEEHRDDKESSKTSMESWTTPTGLLIDL
ncbi:Nn.00g047260.m01.CDS01 [Neocucurbitaria sp. VM-36]